MLIVGRTYIKPTAELYLGHAVTSRYICNDEQTTLKVSNTLYSLVPELAEFTMPSEEIAQNNFSRSQLSERNQER